MLSSTWSARRSSSRAPTPRSCARAWPASSTRSRTASPRTAGSSRSSRRCGDGRLRRAVAHEDDPERAVRAALAIVDAVRELASRSAIGVESGEIVADETETTFATGLAVNAAARLQQAAEPGEVLLGPDVERLTRDTVVTTPLGTQAARGFPAGVEAWRVVRSRSEVGRRLTVSVPFVGREEELELLPQHVCPRGAGTARVHLVTVYGARRASASRGLHGSSSTASSASTILSGPLPSVRRGRHVLGGRGDGEGRRRDHRRRLASTRRPRSSGTAAGDEAGCGSPRARVRCSRRGRRRAARVEIAGPRRPGRPSSPTCSRSCSCSRTSTGPRSRCST